MPIVDWSVPTVQRHYSTACYSVPFFNTAVCIIPYTSNAPLLLKGSVHCACRQE